jgi:hypothetical protein
MLSAPTDKLRRKSRSFTSAPISAIIGHAALARGRNPSTIFAVPFLAASSSAPIGGIMGDGPPQKITFAEMRESGIRGVQFLGIGRLDSTRQKMLLFFLTPWMLLKIFTSPLLPILKSPRRGEGHDVQPDFN